MRKFLESQGYIVSPTIGLSDDHRKIVHVDYDAGFMYTTDKERIAYVGKVELDELAKTPDGYFVIAVKDRDHYCIGLKSMSIKTEIWKNADKSESRHDEHSQSTEKNKINSDFELEDVDEVFDFNQGPLTVNVTQGGMSIDMYFETNKDLENFAAIMTKLI